MTTAKTVAKNCMNDSAILHIVNQSGGGTMRYIEALIHSREMPQKQFVWYVGKHQHILFDVRTPFYYAFSAKISQEEQQDLVLSLIMQNDVTHLGLHLHSFFGSAIAVAEQWRVFPTIATFHDHHFLNEIPFINNQLSINPKHIERIQKLLCTSSILTPSNYLYKQALRYFSKEQLHVIPHGTEEPANELDKNTKEFVEQLKYQANWDDNKFTVATIGAIGEEKGLAFMKEWLETTTEIQFVCVGFSADFDADQNRPQATEGNIVHGFYHHAEVAQLLKAYYVDIVVFFPGVAESFCYALSDIAGVVPVLAPDNGALGERVKKENLGATYPIDLRIEEFTQQIKQTVQKGSSFIPIQQTIKSMTLQTAHYYKHGKIDDVLKKKLSPEKLSELLEDQLHSDNLKWELAILVRQNFDLSTVREELKKSNADIIQQGEYIEEQRQYITELQLELEKANQALNEYKKSRFIKSIELLRSIIRCLINKFK